MLSFSGDINSNYYHTYPNESTTVAVYTATAYTLTIDQGTGTNLEVYLYSSPFQSASGVLTNGKTIYGGEILRVWGAVQSEAYKDFVLNVSGVGNLSTGATFTVSGNHTVKTTATLKTYTLTISADSHSEIAVKRGAETLISGDIINHFDLLTVTFSTASGYKVKTATLNGGDIASPADHTVTGDVTIVLVTEATGFVYIDNTVAVNPYIPYIDRGDHWEQHISNIDNRSAFELYGG